MTVQPGDKHLWAPGLCLVTVPHLLLPLHRLFPDFSCQPYGEHAFPSGSLIRPLFSGCFSQWPLKPLAQVPGITAPAPQALNNSIQRTQLERLLRFISWGHSSLLTTSFFLKLFPL